VSMSSNRRRGHFLRSPSVVRIPLPPNKPVAHFVAQAKCSANRFSIVRGSNPCVMKTSFDE
jgi:hypothetical protein